MDARKDRERSNEGKGNKVQKEAEQQSDATANVEAAMLQVLHDKPASKQSGHTLYTCCSSHIFLRLIHVFSLNVL